MPNFLIASSAFKGSFSPHQVADAINSGLQDFAHKHNYVLDTKIIPLADGGDGTLEAIFAAAGGSLHNIECPDALGDTKKALWLKLYDTAIVELASACGIAELSELKPLEANTRGLGVVINQLVEKEKFDSIVVAVGGSASTDGGSGALYEMGAKFLDAEGIEIIPQGGGSLKKIAACDLSHLQKKFHGIKIKVATDVINPLLGANGAANIFGPQKGASEKELSILESGLARFADVLEQASDKHLRLAPGSGAAGGTAFGLACAAGAEIISGFAWISDITQLEDAVKKSDIVIAAEGRFDRSSLFGKTTGMLLSLCQRYDKELWVVTGSTDETVASINQCKIIVATNDQSYASLEDLQQATNRFAQANLT